MKILIVGVGSIGTRHLKNLLKLGYKDIVVCDPDEKKLMAASSASRRIGKFALYKNAKTALKKELPNVVFVCNPTHLHVPTASLAIDYGAHVFIEKPLSVNLSGVDSLIKKASVSGKTVMIACNFLFYEGFRKLQNVLKRGVYGKAMLCRVAQGFYIPLARKNINYKKSYIAKKAHGGGVILDHVAHPIYYLTALFGDIKKRSSLLSGKHPLGFQSEEMALLMLKHKNGIISGIASDYICKKSTHRIEVVTTKGLLTLDPGKDSLIFEDRKSKKNLYRGDKNLNKMFIEEIKHFLNCIKRGIKPPQDLEGGKKFLQVLLS